MSGSGGWKLSLEELVSGTEGRVVSQFSREYRGVGTDTRIDLSGLVFFALKGDSFDAHDFLSKAADANAAALVVHRLSDADAKALENRVTIVQVDDTLKALQLLGNFWRHKMKARIVGVTGTNGKTTTKEFSAAIIGSKLRVQYSKGSFNNHWGVPISLLSIAPEHEVAVIEMGMNHPGELKVLDEIAEPDAVLCTMVGRGHLEGVGSIEGAARAKSEIYEFAPKSATRIFNLENDHTLAMFEKFGRSHPPEKVLTFAGLEYAREKKWVGLGGGLEPTISGTEAWPRLDVSFEVVTIEADSIVIRGEIQGVGGETRVPVFGRQNVTNLMAASCFALHCGLTPAEIWTALPLCKNAWGRNQWVDLQSGARALFDAYNANPESMRAAIENFAQLSIPRGGRKIAILGEMREMGSHAPAVHRELGEVVGRAKFDEVCFVGPSSAEFASGLKSAGHLKTPVLSNTYEQNLAATKLPVLDEKDFVLIKGSRGMQLEKALADLKPVSFEPKK
ncbi:MAG: UDP-N-acetylmuramoyl-tripeptide--D-alanyl-D-alanine ligase [Bdellovibrionota bacterium]